MKVDISYNSKNPFKRATEYPEVTKVSKPSLLNRIKGIMTSKSKALESKKK